MVEDELKGKTKKVKGKIMEGTGKLTGDKRKILEGKLKQA